LGGKVNYLFGVSQEKPTRFLASFPFFAQEKFTLELVPKVHHAPKFFLPTMLFAVASGLVFLRVEC
jgi:hypothetical protein